MEIIKTKKEMQIRSDLLRREGKRIGFVPTLGAIHEGHLSLVRLSKEKTDVTVTSIFLNPTQFGPHEDFEKYPRDPEKDERLLQEEGCDILFLPSQKEMYPDESQSTVHVEELTEGLCGDFRPGHFRGVATVVSKLFNIVKPHLAIFGQKDFQQARVIQRMVHDLDFDIEIHMAPIVREEDGLAMSSRNSNLSQSERERARILHHSLQKGRVMIEGGERNSGKIIHGMREMIVQNREERIEYIEIVDLQKLKPVSRIDGEVLLALAVWVGKTRLIDNIVVTGN